MASSARRGCLLLALACFALDSSAFSPSTLPLRRGPPLTQHHTFASRRNPPARVWGGRVGGGLRMSGLGSDWLKGYKEPVEQDLDWEKRGEVKDLNEETRTLFEDNGLITDGRWSTEEEIQAYIKTWFPDGWPDAAWPMGAPDIGHMDASDLLVNPEVGGEAKLFPMGAPKVLCYGEMLLDVIANSPTVKLGDSADNWTPFPGGAPANVACALTKLGTPAAFMGTVGADADGDLLLEELEKNKMPTHIVQRTPDRATRRVYVTKDKKGEREFAGFPAKTDTFADCVTDLAEVDGTLFYAADYVVTGTLGLAYPSSREALMAIKKQCAEVDAVRITDVNWRPVFWEDEKKARELIGEFIQGTGFLKATADEVEWLFGIDKKSAMEKPQLVLNMVPEALGVLITDGGNGVAYAFEQHGGRMPAFDVPVVDSTGAGDAFTAGFLHWVRLATDAWQEEEVDLGEDKMYPRGHMPVKERIAEFFKDKEMCANAVVYASAVGAITCMEDGAIEAQPGPSLVDKFVDMYEDDVIVTEEKRDFKMPDMQKEWWKWRYSGQ